MYNVSTHIFKSSAKISKKTLMNIKSVITRSFEDVVIQVRSLFELNNKVQHSICNSKLFELFQNIEIVFTLDDVLIRFERNVNTIYCYAVKMP